MGELGGDLGYEHALGGACIAPVLLRRQAETQSYLPEPKRLTLDTQETGEQQAIGGGGETDAGIRGVKSIDQICDVYRYGDHVLMGFGD